MKITGRRVHKMRIITDVADPVIGQGQRA